MPDDRLDLLMSRAEITEVVIRYARAVDRLDEPLLRSCFHPDARHWHGDFEGLSADFCTRAMEICRQVVATHHQLGPVSIDLDGDVAHAETYFVSHHRHGEIPPPGGRPHEDRVAAGRYVDRFERRGGAWKIAERVGVMEFLRYDPPSDRGFWADPPGQRGSRDRSDPVYRR